MVDKSRRLIRMVDLHVPPASREKPIESLTHESELMYWVSCSNNHTHTFACQVKKIISTNLLQKNQASRICSVYTSRTFANAVCWLPGREISLAKTFENCESMLYMTP